jgi:hypothetical protein
VPSWVRALGRTPSASGATRGGDGHESVTLLRPMSDPRSRLSPVEVNGWLILPDDVERLSWLAQGDR